MRKRFAVVKKAPKLSSELGCPRWGKGRGGWFRGVDDVLPFLLIAVKRNVRRPGCHPRLRRQSCGGAEKIPVPQMEHLLEQRGYHLDDELKVSHFSWPSAASLLPAINFLPRFLFLPVFLQILLCESTAQDPPPVPSLSADPSEPLYLVGENISLRCSAPNNTVQSWRQYLFSQIRKNENEISIKDLDCHEENSLVLTVTRDDSGLYKCRYLEQKYGRTISSEWSHPVSIVVRDPLPPPVLKLHPPSGSLQEGKVLCIQCLPNEGNNTKRFHFSWKGVEMASSSEGLLRSSRDSGLLTLNMSVAFLYANGDGSLGLACRWEENINGRWIMSPWSQIVNITDQSGKSVGGQHLPNNTVNIRTENLTSDQIKIICNCKIRETSWGWPSSPESNQLVFSVVDELPSPPSPLLKVDPVSQVKEGDPLVFLCSVEGSNAEKIFHFYKDGMEITSREEGLLEPSTEPTDRVQSASLRILHASFNHSGEFACSYEEKRTNQWLVSSWSQGLNMTGEPVKGMLDVVTS
ncbi:hypothetical protein Chor_009706 [Crotalus horridus]